MVPDSQTFWNPPMFRLILRRKPKESVTSEELCDSDPLFLCFQHLQVWVPLWIPHSLFMQSASVSQPQFSSLYSLSSLALWLGINSWGNNLNIWKTLMKAHYSMIGRILLIMWCSCIEFIIQFNVISFQYLKQVQCLLKNIAVW